MVRYEDLTKGEVALVAWRHGKDYGGHLASLMVAHCLRNRFVAGWGTWFRIIETIPQHSAILEQPSGWPDQWDRNFLKVLVDMDAIFDGTAKDLSNKAVYWADTAKIDNPRFLEKVARNPEHHRVADMGSLQFWD